MEATGKLLQAFYLISGMRIALYDRQFHCLAWAGSTAYSFCNAVHTTAAGLDRCFRSDIDAFQAVEKTRKTHTFTCPFGLFEAITPICESGDLVGYLFVGEAILQSEAQKGAALAQARLFVESTCSDDRLRELIEALACHSGAALDAFVDTLELFAAKIATIHAFDSSKHDIAALTKIYIRDNYHKKITLSELALHFHCSTVTLTESFRKAYGTSIMAHVTAERMRAAAELLKSTSLSCTTVAEKCGFENIEHFSKVFKKTYGLSPAHWRKEQ